MVESGVKSLSKPVLDKLEPKLGQLDDFACRQLDKVNKQNAHSHAHTHTHTLSPSLVSPQLLLFLLLFFDLTQRDNMASLDWRCMCALCIKHADKTEQRGGGGRESGLCKHVVQYTFKRTMW